MRRLLAVALALLIATVAATNKPGDQSVFAHPMAPPQLRLLTAAAVDPLAKAQVVRGEFSQRRFARGLPQPLESHGEFLFVQKIGIEWRTLTPIEARIVVTPSGIKQDQGAATGAGSSGIPDAATQMIARIFFGLFALDYASLARDFTTFGEMDGDRWRVGLQAKRSALGHMFKRAVLTGSTAASAIVLYDAAGGRSEILLQNLRFDSLPPSPAERARF